MKLDDLKGLKVNTLRKWTVFRSQTGRSSKWTIGWDEKWTLLFQYILEYLISSSYTDKLLWCLTYLKSYPFLLEYFTRLQHLSTISLFIYNILLHTIILLRLLENVFNQSTSISSFYKSHRWSKLWTGSIEFVGLPELGVI